MILRRDLLRRSALLGSAAVLSPLAAAFAQPQDAPIRVIMAGYGPSTTSFSLALKRIGERIENKFPGEIEVRYVYNILDLGYLGRDILWLVEDGIVGMGYQSSSYLSNRVSALGAVDLPFIFENNMAARAAMDGELGRLLTQSIEANSDFRILGYFENGERHISNRLRPIRTPEDLSGIAIRTLPSEIHKRTFELLGAEPEIMDLSEVIQRIQAGTIDAQENPFANTVTYGVHNFHRYHTASSHFYISRPIFFHRPTFDSLPSEIQQELRAAVSDAVSFQRNLKDREELAARAAIEENGGEIIELSAEERQRFIDAVTPVYDEFRPRYSESLQRLIGL